MEGRGVGVGDWMEVARGLDMGLGRRERRERVNGMGWDA
jgi:hypothetical protein